MHNRRAIVVGVASLLVVVALATVSYCAGPGVVAVPTGTPAPVLIEARVTRVIDGNSLDAQIEGRRTAVGYLGVEAPTVRQSCGQEALARNVELAGGGVLLEADATHEFDANGRRLYYAYTRDRVSIDETLVREGLARAARTDARHGARLARLQTEAEAAGRGCLWRRDGSR